MPYYRLRFLVFALLPCLLVSMYLFIVRILEEYSLLSLAASGSVSVHLAAIHYALLLSFSFCLLASPLASPQLFTDEAMTAPVDNGSLSAQNFQRSITIPGNSVYFVLNSGYSAHLYGLKADVTGFVDKVTHSCQCARH